LDQLIKNRIRDSKSIALLAPSFPIDFEYPQIIAMLKSLGFDMVTELTFGARMVNWWYVDYIKRNPEQKYFIASPCPTLVAYIKSRHPNLVQYLMPYASPMLSEARIIKQHYPEYLNFFISPCIAKKTIEAPLYPEVISGVITFKELKDIFNEERIYEQKFDQQYQFDSLIQEYTKIYPVSGGLAHTAHLLKVFKPEEILIDDTIARIEPVLTEMEEGKTSYRFLDILNCDGGCIGGPAIINQQLSRDEKKLKVKRYVDLAGKNSLGAHRGRLSYADGVDLGVNFNLKKTE